jgi:uncharacterized membrane protein
MTDVQVETIIRRPPEEVAGYAMNPENDRSWIGALTEVNVLTEGPIGEGTRVERVAQFLGKRIEYVNEIVEYAPPARLRMKSVKAPFPMTVDYEFAETNDGTLVRISTGSNASGFYKLAGPLLDRAVRKGVARDLKRLKAILEQPERDANRGR